MVTQKEFLPTNISKPILASRSTGALNLINRGLETLPRSVWDVKVELDGAGPAWYELAALTSLNLSQNLLRQLPDEIAEISTLRVLNCNGNELKHLPDTLTALTDLKLLDVAANQLAGTLDCLVGITSLAKLVVSDNPLTALPEALGGQQGGLCEVLADRCKLTDLPAGFARASGLLKLSCAGNALRDINSNVLAGLSKVTALDWSHNRLERIPEAIGCCTSLVILSLCHNALEALPPALGLCTRLVELDVSCNRLATLPDELGLLECLAQLSAHDNRLAALGAGVPTLASLRLLNVANNELAALPAELGALTALRALPLSGNPLKAVPRGVRDGPISKLLEHLRNKQAVSGEAACSAGTLDAMAGGASGADGLAAHAARALALGAAAEEAARGDAAEARASSAPGKELDLSGQGLMALPAEVWEAGAAVAVLKVARNKIKGMPCEGMACLQRLRLLDASHNALESWPLPAARAALPALRTLDVAFNKGLPVLPPAAFAACGASLRELNLSGCASAAQDLSALVSCSALQTLHLDQCRLGAFPPPVLALKALSVLGVGNNAIAELPAEVTTLAALSALDVRNNSLATLPPQLALLPLRSLLVEGNMLRTLRRSVIERGTPALLEHLRTRLPVP